MSGFSQNILNKKFILVLLALSFLSACSSEEAKYSPSSLFLAKPQAEEVVKEELAAKPAEKESKQSPVKKPSKKEVKPEPKKEPVKNQPEPVAEKQKQASNPTPEQPHVDVANIDLPVVNKIYKVEWLNVTVAYFFAEIKNNAGNISFKFHSQSVGMVDRLANFGWSSLTNIRMVENGFMPVSVDRISELKNKSRHITINYDGSGNITSDTQDPPENRSKRPAVSAQDKNKTYDVLTLILQSRYEIMNVFKNGSFGKDGDAADEATLKYPLYDGRKRSDIQLTVYRAIQNNNFKVRVRQKAVSGYTANELKDVQKGDKYVDVFVDAETYLPMRASGKSPLGSAVATYVGDCTKAFEECIKDYENK